MDEVELLRKWGGPGPQPSEASITVARAAPQRSIEALGTGKPAFLSIRRLEGRLGRPDRGGRSSFPRHSSVAVKRWVQCAREGLTSAGRE